MSGAVAKPDAHTSGDPIGTAQERELIERLRNAARWYCKDRDSHASERFNEAADALQSRIAEVERLTARVSELEAEMQCECGGKMLMAHNHPCPTYGAALSQGERL